MSATAAPGGRGERHAQHAVAGRDVEAALAGDRAQQRQAVGRRGPEAGPALLLDLAGRGLPAADERQRVVEDVADALAVDREVAARQLERAGDADAAVVARDADLRLAQVERRARRDAFALQRERVALGGDDRDAQAEGPEQRRASRRRRSRRPPRPRPLRCSSRRPAGAVAAQVVDRRPFAQLDALAPQLRGEPGHERLGPDVAIDARAHDEARVVAERGLDLARGLQRQASRSCPRSRATADPRRPARTRRCRTRCVRGRGCRRRASRTRRRPRRSRRAR